jgi:hypothetical protein
MTFRTTDPLRPMHAMARASLLLLVSGLCALPAAGQDGRGSLHSTARYVELRPLQQDTIPRELVTALPDGSFRYDGLPASCGDTNCVVLRSGAMEYGVLATQDFDFTAWGLGIEGLSTTFLLRGRTHLAGEFRQPRSDETFEAILGYAEFTRGAYRLRAGRQRELSGLGFSGFDGLDLMIEPTRALRGHVYGGRSLARAVQQPYTRAFRDIEERDFIRDRDAYLLGGEVAVESRGGGMLALRYQGEVWSDRGGLLSERALLLGRTTGLRPLVLSGSAEYDMGYGRLGKAHLDVMLPMPASRVVLEATARRYLPFFEYWTIWGLFSPVAYHELEMRAGWQPLTSLGVRASGAYRQYGAHGTQTFLGPLENRAWRAGLAGDWRASDRLRVDASVRVEGPVGAFTAGGDAALEWRLTQDVTLLLHGLVLEQMEEFRFGAGVVGGGGIGADARLTDAIRAAGGVELYRQGQPDRPGGVDWTQRRGWFSLHLDVGRDPGMPRQEAP